MSEFEFSDVMEAAEYQYEKINELHVFMFNELKRGKELDPNEIGKRYLDIVTSHLANVLASES